MMTTRRVNRKQEILQTLAEQLEKNPGAPIRTASLAKATGVSEAALYRHFPSKAKMFEALIQFAEETIFSRLNKVHQEQKSVFVRCEALVHLLLTFADRNPGIVRVLMGDAIMGESEKLRIRVSQFFDRLETQIKQFLREGVMHHEIPESANIAVLANMVSAYIEGRINQFQRSNFQQSPLNQSDKQWPLIVEMLKSA
ncbi:MAG: nucleoid occlusion factor SlmA [Gammaproteobacteria bacterium]|nr:nucleoid occlusion factor SlmA [Gammaproteobacteria bacterium]